MKNIYKKIKISYMLYIIIFLSLLSGLFKDILCLFLIIILHELGHIISSLYYKWKIDNIKIGVCGGYITYDEIIDKPFKEEFIISISGILMQMILYIIFLLLFKNLIIDERLYFMLNKYNNAIILFNLLPVIPLDGSKILNIIFNNIFSYKSSLKLSNVTSCLIIILLLLIFINCKIKIETSYIIILSFIINKIIINIKEVPYLFNKFIIERYIYQIKVLKYKYIKSLNISKMNRQKKHYFYVNGKYYSEKEILSKIFD